MSTLELPALYVDTRRARREHAAARAREPRPEPGRDRRAPRRDASRSSWSTPGPTASTARATRVLDRRRPGVRRRRACRRSQPAFDGPAAPASRRPRTRCASCCIRWRRSRARPRSPCAWSRQTVGGAASARRDVLVRRRGPHGAAGRRCAGARAEDRARRLRRARPGPERRGLRLRRRWARRPCRWPSSASTVEGSVVLLTLDTEMTPDVAARGRGTRRRRTSSATPSSRPTTARRSPASAPRARRRGASTSGRCSRSTTAATTRPATSSASSPACRR